MDTADFGQVLLSIFVENPLFEIYLHALLLTITIIELWSENGCIHGMHERLPN